MMPNRGRKPQPAERPRLLVVVSDLHCGSTMGLCPPGARVVDSGSYNLNPCQEWLWERWLAFGKWVEELAGGDPYDLLLNGDLIDGYHHKTAQVITVDVGLHIEAAVECIKPLADKARRKYVVIGTEIHVSDTENAIGKHIGAECVGGRFASHEWRIRMGGVLLSARHHMTTTKRKYLEASSLGIELGNQQLEAARAGHPVPQVVIAGHRHRFGVYSDGKGMMVACPPFQLLTNYGHRVVPGVVPEVGGFALDFRGKADGELPDVRHKLWTVASAEYRA